MLYPQNCLLIKLYHRTVHGTLLYREVKYNLELTFIHSPVHYVLPGIILLKFGNHRITQEYCKYNSLVVLMLLV